MARVRRSGAWAEVGLWVWGKQGHTLVSASATSAFSACSTSRCSVAQLSASLTSTSSFASPERFASSCSSCLMLWDRRRGCAPRHFPALHLPQPGNLEQAGGVRAEAGALVARTLPEGQPGSPPFGSVTLGLSFHICKMGLL